VNPSLTIAAVCERGMELLTGRAADLGLPGRPPGFAHGVPEVTVGERVVPDVPRYRSRRLRPRRLRRRRRR
jgi:hypothetical protein